VKNEITQWIHNWNRNGWKNAKNAVANATLWRELDTAVARQTRAELTWVRDHNRISLIVQGANGIAGRTFTRFPTRGYQTELNEPCAALLRECLFIAYSQWGLAK
jgi:hypothetical protein